MVHHDDLVGEALGLEQQVRAHDDGLAVLGHLVDEAEHVRADSGSSPAVGSSSSRRSGSWSTARASASRARMPVE